MTAHELAKRLLENPDYDIVLSLECAKDSVTSMQHVSGGCEPLKDLEVSPDHEESIITLSVFMPNARFGHL